MNGLSKKCDNSACGSVHRYKCFYRTKDGDVLWFCCTECRADYEDQRITQLSLREYARTGGWV